MSRAKMTPVILVALGLLASATAALTWLFGAGTLTAPEALKSAKANIQPPSIEPANASPTPINIRREIGKSFTLIRSGILRPQGDPRAWIESRYSAANSGNPEASYEIYLAYKDCEMYLKASSPEELAFARLIGASQDYEATVLRKLEECETLQPTAEKAAKWLVMAANQGSIEAQIAYATSPESTLGPRPDHESHEFQEWKRNASSYLYESMQKGSVDALSALADAYGTGLIVPRSVVKEYALQMTLERINPAYSSRKHLEELRSILTPAQIEEARKTSKSTYLTLTGNSPDL